MSYYEASQTFSALHMSYFTERIPFQQEIMEQTENKAFKFYSTVERKVFEP